MESGINSSLHVNCHRHLNNLSEIQNPLSPSIETGNMATKKLVHHIRREINEFSRERSCENNSVNGKVNIFNITMKNILLNYIADETITSGNDFRD